MIKLRDSNVLLFFIKVLQFCVVFQNEVRGQMEKLSVNESLVKEIERLTEENRRLKNKY